MYQVNDQLGTIWGVMETALEAVSLKFYLRENPENHYRHFEVKKQGPPVAARLPGWQKIDYARCNLLGCHWNRVGKEEWWRGPKRQAYLVALAASRKNPARLPG